MKIYQVGGAVRDRIRGQQPNDIDYVVVGSTVEEMLRLGFVKVGRGFPVFLHPITKQEYALARKEVKIGNKHTDFEFVFTPDITLREDLERRDFTCNAIAYDDQNDEYIDYFDGMQDINKRILRHVNSTHFAEDPLRILRMCRFAAQLDFSVADSTLELCKKMVSDGMIEHLTAERIWNELMKAMKSQAFHRFIELAREIGALRVMMPEVDKMWETPERLQFHPEGNTGGHVLSAIKMVENAEPLVKFAVLLHDVGKVLTPPEILPAHIEHEIRAKQLIKSLCQRIKAPKQYCYFAKMVGEQHMKFHYIPDMNWGKLYNLAEAMTIGHICYVEQFIAVCRADSESSLHEDYSSQRQIFAQSADLLRKACCLINEIKAEDMPNFDRLPKDERFKELLRDYKIKILREKLSFLK